MDPGSTPTQRLDHAPAGALTVLAPGQRLGAWRLLRAIGAGGAGVVWLAERADTQYEQQVAIKINRSVASPEAAEQLRRERQILAALDHPLIARLLDGGETADGHPWLAMDYVRGEPITLACEHRGLGIEARLRLIADSARAVQHAHQRLVIHRDIKPANLMLRDDGRPVLLDFGIARPIAFEESATPATHPWFTPAYASPEQKRHQPISTASDLYTLGLVLCELLSGKEPEVNAEGQVTLPSQRAPMTLRKRLRGDLDAIVARACAPEPERRYASADAFADDLERWLRGEPIVARPDSTAYRAAKFVRRHPLGVGLGAGALALIVATLGWLSLERSRAQSAEQQARREAAAAAAVTDYLVEVFQSAEPGAAPAQALTPLALIDRGHAALARRPDLGGDARLRLLGTLGRIYGNLGEPERATGVLREAVELADRELAPTRERIEHRLALATALAERSRHADALDHYREALALAEQEHLDAQATILRGECGLMLARLHRHEEAAQAFDRALAESTQRHGADAPASARLRLYRAEALMLDDQLERADAESARALLSLRRALSADDPELLAALTMRAAILRSRGDTAAAASLLEHVVARRQALLGHDNVLLASALSGLGSAYYEQGRTLDATRELAASLAISRLTLDPGDPGLAIDLNNLGSLYEEQGDYARAEPLLREAVAIYRPLASDEPLQAASLVQNLGRLLLLAGQAVEARALLDEPIADTPGSAWDLLRARQRLHLAEWERRHGDPVRAKVHLAAVTPDALGGADSPRLGAWLRGRGLLAARRGDDAEAARLLAAAHDHYVRTRRPDWVGVGEVALDQAELALRRGATDAARRHAAEAERVLDPVLAAEAPQRPRLLALRRQLAPPAAAPRP